MSLQLIEAQGDRWYARFNANVASEQLRWKQDFAEAVNVESLGSARIDTVRVGIQCSALVAPRRPLLRVFRGGFIVAECNAASPAIAGQHVVWQFGSGHPSGVGGSANREVLPIDLWLMADGWYIEAGIFNEQEDDILTLLEITGAFQ